MSRPSNLDHMTGRELQAADDGAYPWALLTVGDWFTARCPAASLASIQNKKGSAVYGAVNKHGRNFVVRIK